MNISPEKEIETNTTQTFISAKSAAQDAARRSEFAKRRHQSFFDDPAHIVRVEQTKSIVKAFLGVDAVYVNQRGLGRTKPFTVVKVEKPLFPNHLSVQEKKDRFYDPLGNLGVEIVFAKGSDSYLFRVK